MLPDTHTLQRFDNELEAIRSNILMMGGLVELQFISAMQALSKTDAHLARQIIDQDQRVNQLEVKTDALCCNAIARFNPIANDLRLIVTATKIIVHLERIGDEAKKIAHVTERRAQQYHLGIPRFVEIKHATDLTQSMLKEVLDSYARQEPISANILADRNELVKAEFENILRHLIEFMSENPHSITSSLDFFLITKAIERISTHVRFIAELILESSNKNHYIEYRQNHIFSV